MTSLEEDRDIGLLLYEVSCNNLEEVLLSLVVRVEEVALSIIWVFLSQKSVIYILRTCFGSHIEVIGMKHAVFVEFEGISKFVEVLHALR
jgi:hypothetical protein